MFTISEASERIKNDIENLEIMSIEVARLTASTNSGSIVRVRLKLQGV